MAFKLLLCISFLILATLSQGAGYYKPKFILSGRGGICGRRRYICKRGLTCIRGRCFQIVGVGARCNVRRFIICSKGLLCRSGRCAKPLRPVGSPCGSTSDCEKGLTCEANPMGKKICTDTRSEGETCDANRGLKCGRGLVCRNGRCRKIRRKVGESCSVTSDCENGLTCEANPMGKKICTDTRSEGETCDADRGLKCGRGLVCKNGRCRKIRRKVGESCSVTSDCESGLTCEANPMGKKICTDTRSEGETCDANRGLKCARGLVCLGGRCRRPLSGLGGPCKTTQDCKRGLTCLGRRGRGKCFDVQGEGESCGRPFVVCARGLKCDRHVCRRRKKYYY